MISVKQERHPDLGFYENSRRLRLHDVFLRHSTSHLGSAELGSSLKTRSAIYGNSLIASSNYSGWFNVLVALQKQVQLLRNQ